MTDFVFGLETPSPPPAELVPLPSLPFDIQRIDHEARAYARLPVQFREAPNMRAMVRSRSVEAQEIEDAIVALLGLPSIEESVGAQLDVIGRIVGQLREGRSDAVYRIWLRVRIRLNRGNGRVADVLAVMRLAAGPAADIRYESQPPATFAVRVYALDEDASSMRDVLTEATAAGVRSIFEYSDRPASELFRLDAGPGLDQGHLAGEL